MEDVGVFPAIRAVFRIAGFVTVAVFMGLLQSLWIYLKLPHWNFLPKYYHRFTAWILGLQIKTVGTICREKPVLYVSNHVSYLDITILGCLLDGSFVSKAEVGQWPLYGWLSSLQKTVYIDRRPEHAGAHRDDMAGRLRQGDNLILFPEGTSSDGNRTLPFKTALFSVANTRVNDRPVIVQPISLLCRSANDIPLGRNGRALYAWYGDMTLLPHLWRLACCRNVQIEVIFHEPVDVEKSKSRKKLADDCWKSVAYGLSEAISGRGNDGVASRIAA